MCMVSTRTRPQPPFSLLWKFLIEIPTRSRAGGAAAKTARPPPRRRARACRSNEDWLAKYWMVIDEAERNEIQLQQTSRGLMRQLRCEIYVLSLRAREHFCHHCEIKMLLVLLSGAESWVWENVIQPCTPENKRMAQSSNPLLLT